MTHFKPKLRMPCSLPLTAVFLFKWGIDFMALYHPCRALPECDKNGRIFLRFDWKGTLTLFMVDERNRTPPSFSLVGLARPFCIR